MAEKLTMADIAELAGVTKSTVSRYFNGGSIKEETRKKIQNVVKENNYIPNSFARLKAKESNTVGVIVPTLNSKVTSRVVTSIGRYLKGSVRPVTESADEMFASKMLGDGIAVDPADGMVYAPCDGTVSLLFPTKHAVGIKSAEGVELLIHAGINTVQLNGEGFEAFVAQGDAVKKGDKLLKADLDFIREKGLNPQTMMIFPEAMNLEIIPIPGENVNENTAAVQVVKK